MLGQSYASEEAGGRMVTRNNNRFQGLVGSQRRPNTACAKEDTRQRQDGVCGTQTRGSGAQGRGEATSAKYRQQGKASRLVVQEAVNISLTYAMQRTLDGLPGLCCPCNLHCSAVYEDPETFWVQPSGPPPQSQECTYPV